MMLRVQRDENLGIAAADGSVGAVRLVDAGVGQTNVVEHRLQLAFRNLLAQHSFNFVAESGRLFHAQAGPRTYMQT